MIAKIIRVSLIIGVLGFFSLHLVNLDYSVLRQIRISGNLLLLGTVISVLYRYWGVLVWRNILVDLGATSLPSFGTLSTIYAKSWMARYIPGTIAWVAGKVYFARNLGISKNRLTVATLTDSSVQLASVMAISLILVSLESRIYAIVPLGIQFLAPIIVCGLIVILLPSIFNKILHFGYKLVMKEEPFSDFKTNGRTVLFSFIYHIQGAFISGTAYYFLISAFAPKISFTDYFFIVGVVNLSGAIGTATPFVPSGLGTRDASLYLLLSVILSNEIALAITVFSRLWSALVDLVFLALSLLVSSIRPG